MAKSNLTAERLRERLDYNQETGAFIWKVKPSQAISSGSVAGSARSGYIGIQIDGRIYLAHRLVFLFIYGAFPLGEVDHINGIRDDNRLANLRDVTKSVNMQNKKVGKHGRKIGTWYDAKNGKWTAQIKIGATQHHLGRFATEEAANSAYILAKAKLHPGYAP